MSECTSRGVRLKDPIGQSIIDGFTKHYGILKIFQLMIHFGFLAENCDKKGAVDLIADVVSGTIELLKNQILAKNRNFAQ